MTSEVDRLPIGVQYPPSPPLQSAEVERFVSGIDYYYSAVTSGSDDYDRGPMAMTLHCTAPQSTGV